MSPRRFPARLARSRALPAAAALILLTIGAAALDPVTVSQSSRAFHPSQIVVPVGATLRVVNDDGELLHHAYVAAPDLKFDSGEQDPGTAVLIRFPNAGTYAVLCAIHPRMRLDVTVR